MDNTILQAGMRNALIGAIIGGLITGVPSYIALTMQAEELKNNESEIKEIKDQTSLMREALEKKSYILMFAKILSGTIRTESTSFIVVGGPNGTASIVDAGSSQQSEKMLLHVNDTAEIELILSNVGNSVAYLYSYHISAVPDSPEKNVTIFKTGLQRQLDVILQPDMKTFHIPISLEITDDFAPSGRIIIEVLHNAGVNKVTLDYEVLPSAFLS